MSGSVTRTMPCPIEPKIGLMTTSPIVRTAAIASSVVSHTTVAGVDLLPSRDGEVFVLEVNGIPGWQGLQQATGVDVAAAIVAHVEALVSEARPAPAGR